MQAMAVSKLEIKNNLIQQAVSSADLIEKLNSSKYL